MTTTPTAMVKALEDLGYTVTLPYRDPELLPGDWVGTKGNKPNCVAPPSRYAFLPTFDGDSEPFWDFHASRWQCRMDLPEEIEVIYRYGTPHD